MSRTTVRIIAFAAGISILAACSSPAAPIGPATVKATVSAEPGSSVAIAAALVMYDMSVMSTMASSVIPLMPGIYLGPASPVDADGTVHLILPDPADLPSEVLGTADSFVWIPSSPPGVCPTTASLPSAKVSTTVFGEGTSVPMVAVITGDGVVVSYSSDKEFDFAGTEEQLFHMKSVSWLYADNDVDTKTATGGCTYGTDTTVVVDLNLRKGWNQVAWTVQQEGGPTGPLTMTLSNGANIDPIYISYSAVPEP